MLEWPLELFRAQVLVLEDEASEARRAAARAKHRRGR